MGHVVKGLDKAMASMDLQKVNQFINFEMIIFTVVIIFMDQFYIKAAKCQNKRETGEI